MDINGILNTLYGQIESNAEDVKSFLMVISSYFDTATQNNQTQKNQYNHLLVLSAKTKLFKSKKVFKESQKQGKMNKFQNKYNPTALSFDELSRCFHRQMIRYLKI